MLYIYSLTDPRTGKAHWVGSTKDPHARLRSHLNEDRPTGKTEWIADLRAAGLTPEMTILVSFEEYERVALEILRKLEQAFIAALLQAGEPLLNVDHIYTLATLDELDQAAQLISIMLATAEARK